MVKERDYLFDAEEVKAILPHRYPFLLVDRILEMDPGQRIVGLKNVTCNEPFFAGHFPGRAIMPGVLVIEAMAQVGCTLVLSLEEHEKKLALIVGVDKVRFRKPVLPGDTLISEVTLMWFRKGLGRVNGVAKVNDIVVAEAEIAFAIVENTPELFSNGSSSK